MQPTRRHEPHFVYHCYDDAGRLLYVGSSISPLLRVEAHRSTSWWGPQIARTRYTVFPNRQHALNVERDAIYYERPACNVKNRWYKRDPRKDWTPEDYVTFHMAVMNGSQIGESTARLLTAIRTEAQNRFGLSLLPLLSQRPTA